MLEEWRVSTDRYRCPGPNSSNVRKILSMSGPVFLTMLFRWRATPMLMPVAHAPMEKALMVIHGASPKQ